MVQHWNVCTIVFWRVVWYRAGTFLCTRSWPRRGCGYVVPVAAVAVTSLTSWPWRPSRPGRGRVTAAAVWFLCRRVAVATRRWMPVFAMVLAWSVLTQFALRL